MLRKSLITTKIMVIRRVYIIVGIGLALSLFALLFAAFSIGASWSTWFYLTAFSLVAVGLIAAGLAQDRVRIASRTGLALLALTLGIRTCSAASGNSVTMTTTAGSGARWLTRIVDEADAALIGGRLAFWSGRVHDSDVPRVPAVMRAAYNKLRAAEGDVPSPVLTTYLGLQSPDGADVIVIADNGSGEPPRGALIFLHGFGGGFTLPCWQLAAAAKRASLVTYCPSLGWRGDWWTERGRQTLEQTLALLRRRGIERVYLAGLSNGAVGAARLAPRLRGVLRGLILISGAPRGGDAPGVPTLVLHGRHDQMASADSARAYATRQGATFVDLNAGHFALLLREEEAMSAITNWLKKN